MSCLDFLLTKSTAIIVNVSEHAHNIIEVRGQDLIVTCVRLQRFWAPAPPAMLVLRSEITCHKNSKVSSSPVPRPKPPCGEEGLVTFERFLVYAHHYMIVIQMVYYA